ncbi:MAG: HPr family phosphocarrier protein [Eubacteriales bacterium]|nr:HPr family phosphocarrier protein [Eubacteriales bacterium]
MTRETVIVGLPKGMESRPVAILVQIASQYRSKIYLECVNKRVNAKSIMGMMTLGLDKGDRIVVEADGEDEETAVGALISYLKNE